MILSSVKITEGRTEIFVPEHEKGSGPKSSNQSVFYNPAMELNRDISISLLKAVGGEEFRVLDGMAASGIRGIRIANEIKPKEVVLTDLSEDAVSLVKQNIKKTDVEAEVINESLEEHLLQNRHTYDYVDIDPFGSPVKYYPTAARFVKRGGIVAVTATDTAVLCGTYPKKCYRLYSSWPKNNWCKHENGLRILIAYCAREAARFQRGVEPLLSYYDGHHFRTYIRILEGARKADESLENLSRFDFTDVGWKTGSETGPLWSNSIFDNDLLEDMEPVGSLDEDLLDLWRNESEMPPFFYDTNILGKYYKAAPPSLNDIIDNIKNRSTEQKSSNEAGWETSKTHFSPTGFKTEAPEEVVLDTFLDMADID